jgi:hypothetical protein
MIADWFIKAGASWPPLKYGVENSNNSAVSLAGASGVGFYLMVDTVEDTMLIDPGTSLNNASMTDSASGYMQYVFTAGDTSGYDGTRCFGAFHVSMPDGIVKVPDEGHIVIFIGKRVDN